MSANRSVQAAQRRRTAPSEAQAPGRSVPQPSINSAQLFANQARGGPGPNIPTGRLAGQQAAMQQQQQQQQQQASISNISKMTLAQAITLITLRLGAVESKLLTSEPGTSMGMGMGMSEEGHENMILVDNEVILSITSRLDSLEKNTSNSSAPSGDNALIKQQIDIIKQSVNQIKIANSSLSKENKELKSQMQVLKKDLDSTKEVLVMLQTITMENSQKLMGYTLEDMNEIENTGYENYEDQLNELENEIEQSEIVGTNLKELIESEINANV
jgi:hypothetical protein